MSIIISWLSSVKLTITQWFGVVAAATIGALVLALRLQGSRLHKAQVQLLSLTFTAAMGQQDARVESARKAYHDALGSYEDSK